MPELCDSASAGFLQLHKVRSRESLNGVWSKCVDHAPIRLRACIMLVTYPGASRQSKTHHTCTFLEHYIVVQHMHRQPTRYTGFRAGNLCALLYPGSTVVSTRASVSQTAAPQKDCM